MHILGASSQSCAFFDALQMQHKETGLPQDTSMTTGTVADALSSRRDQKPMVWIESKEIRECALQGAKRQLYCVATVYSVDPATPPEKQWWYPRAQVK